MGFTKKEAVFIIFTFTAVIQGQTCQTFTTLHTEEPCEGCSECILAYFTANTNEIISKASHATYDDFSWDQFRS